MQRDLRYSSDERMKGCKGTISHTDENDMKINYVSDTAFDFHFDKVLAARSLRCPKCATSGRI